MKQRIPSLDEFINESILSQQIPIILNLKPGDVIYVTDDYTDADIDFSRMSKTVLGKLKQLNTRNMLKTGDLREDWAIGRKDEVKAVVMSNGKLSFQGGWSANIQDINKQDFILNGFNILYTDGKINIRKYNKKHFEERLLVFKENLYHGGYNWYGGDNFVKIQSLDIEFDSTVNNSYTYNKESDTLIINNGFSIQTGEGSKILKIKNASANDDIRRDEKSLNNF